MQLNISVFELFTLSFIFCLLAHHISSPCPFHPWMLLSVINNFFQFTRSPDGFLISFCPISSRKQSSLLRFAPPLGEIASALLEFSLCGLIAGESKRKNLLPMDHFVTKCLRCFGNMVNELFRYETFKLFWKYGK